jgi:hypothetical protein
MVRLRSSKLGDAAAFVLLTALNLAICWRLFKVEYTDHFSSIEGSFIAIARYLSRHWGDASWWPLWHCGMPYQDTYVPLLHAVVAAVAWLGHLSAARAYHGVVGVTYALGAVTLYFMASHLGVRRQAAFLAALVYSLFSPSVFLMPGVKGDVGGIWFARRLQVLTVYGEGPHVTAMTLLPLVILALQLALDRRTARSWAWAAIAIAVVFLTNVPGTMATGLAVFCWICAQPWDRQGAAWKIAASAAAMAYCLACFGVPPSSLATVGGNVGSMHHGFANSMKYGPIPLALALSVVAGVGFLLSKTRLPLAPRFGILYAGLLAPLSATANLETYELLPQVGRLHLEVEIGVCIVLGWAAWTVYDRIPRWIRPVILAACLAPFILQFKNYRAAAHSDVPIVKLGERSEYTTAQWLDRNMHGERVYVTGSTSFWLNAFTDTPQLIGCCDQGESMPVLQAVPYAVNPPKTVAETRQTRAWLQALGVRALVVNGAASTDEYKDIKAPERFAGLFDLLHEQNGDSVYAVQREPASLAHVLHAGEEVLIRPPNTYLFADVERYVNAISAEGRDASLEWVHGGDARIRANLHRDDRLSVQVAWFPGWKAEVQGQAREIARDGLGFIVVKPQCEGACEVDLRWTGRWDLWPARLLSLAALGLIFTIFCTGKLPGMGRFQRTISK